MHRLRSCDKIYTTRACDAASQTGYSLSHPMGPTQQKLTIGLWILAAASVAGVISLQQYLKASRQARAGNSIEVVIQPSTTPTTGPVRLDWASNEERRPVDVEMPAPAFDLIDHTGHPFKSNALKGRVWTAMLFFSNCPGVCPGMKNRVMTLQKQVTDDRVHFVSFSVDPERDTPAKLAEYHKAAGDEAGRWHMLTGSLEQMHTVAAGIGMPYDQPANHSSRILLVDQQGVIRRVYSSSEDSHMKQLADDAKRLAETGRL
jgi:protein SCO1